MMRALWSAASGMIAQQTNVDTISNNIANVNTTGYKTEKTEFKSLLYQNLQARTTTANGENKPIPAQVGLGTRVASNTSMFTQGAMLASESDTAFAIDGEGFFAVRGADGNTYYTRNGNFTWSIGNDGVILTNSDGYPVLKLPRKYDPYTGWRGSGKSFRNFTGTVLLQKCTGKSGGYEPEYWIIPV